MAHRYSFLILFLAATLPLTASRSSKPALARAPAQISVSAIEPPVVMSQVFEGNQPIKSTPPARGVPPLIIEMLPETSR
jgi:hypothetical protein